MASGALETGSYRIYLMEPRSKPTQGGAIARHHREDEKTESPPSTRLKFSVPDRFLSPETSGLWVSLEKESNRIDIDLKD